jgi:hypothetical protein
MLERFVGGVMGTKFGVEVSQNSDPDGVRHGGYFSSWGRDTSPFSFELE